MGIHLQRCILLLLLCHVPIAFIWGFSEHILLALGQEPQLSILAARYLQILFLGMYIFGYKLCAYIVVGLVMRYSKRQRDSFRLREYLEPARWFFLLRLLSMHFCIIESVTFLTLGIMVLCGGHRYDSTALQWPWP